MISSPKNPAPAALPANVTADKLSTNEGGIPLVWFSGRRWLPLNWLQSRIYNPRSAAVTTKVGKSNKTTGYDYFGDLVGALSCCQLDFIEALEIGNKIVWFGYLERDGTNPHFAPITLPDGSQWRIYWGTPDQPADTLVLDDCGEDHPRYLDQAYVVGKNVAFGSSTTPPSIRVLGERSSRFTGLDEGRTREGANPVTAIAELLGDDWFGLGLPDLVDVATWSAIADEVKRATAIAIPDSPDHVASMGYVSPFLDRQQPAQNIIAALLETFDGWLRPLGEALELGRFPHDGVAPSGLSEFSFHDFTAHPRFNAPVSDAEPFTDVVVTFNDREYGGDRNSVQASNAAALRRSGESNPLTVARPFFITTYQAQEQANELAKFLSRPEATAEATIRRSRIGELREGDRFILNDAPSNYLQVVRITQRTDPATGGEVSLRLVEERGLAPLTYVAPPLPTPYLPPPAITAVVNARIFQLPVRFADYGPAPVVVPLAQRPAAHIAGFSLHYSADNVTFDKLETIGRWALRGTLNAGITDSATTLTLAASGFELSLLQAQSAAAQDDDALLLFVGFEILSIGAVTALGGGLYSCGVKRARRGSVAVAHSGAAECWVMPRADLEIFQHGTFPRTTVDRYFKLPTYTPAEDETLGTALAITFLFDDAGVAAPTGLSASAALDSITLVWSNPSPPDPTIVMTEIVERTAATPAPDASTLFDYESRSNFFNRPDAAGLGALYFWVRNRDTISDRSTWVGPVSATATAPVTTGDLDTIADDAADALAAEVAARIADVDAEAAARVAAILAEAVARGAAITSEATTRSTADLSLASDITTLTAAVGTNAAAISSEATARATADSAMATSIATNAAAIGTLTASVTVLSDAYVVGGTAIATWGFKLDGGGKVVKMQAIAASSGTQAEVGVIVFGGADLQSDTFSSGTSGWQLKANGDAEFNAGTFRGTLSVGSGANRTVTDTSGTEFGDDSTYHFKFENRSGSSALVLKNGATVLGFFANSGTGIFLDLSSTGSISVGDVNAQKLSALSSSDPRTSGAPLYSGGGAWIEKSLDVRGVLDVVGAISGASLTVGGRATVNAVRYPGSANDIAFYWDGSNVRVTVDGTLNGTIPNP